MPKPSPVIYHPHATASQCSTIELLFIDCGFVSSIQRKEFLRHRFNRDFTSELAKLEASRVIEELIQIVNLRRT